MRKVTSLAMTLMLAMASTAAFADGTQQNGMLYQSMDHNRMFDGVNLTEHQRQQMRDLMQLARHDLPRVDI
ncbi:MAG: cell-envelope stress modulator CpxP, partial [Hafnia alvei]